MGNAIYMSIGFALGIAMCLCLKAIRRRRQRDAIIRLMERLERMDREERERQKSSIKEENEDE